MRGGEAAGVVCLHSCKSGLHAFHIGCPQSSLPRVVALPSASSCPKQPVLRYIIACAERRGLGV